MQWTEELVSHFRKLKSYSLDQADFYRKKAAWWRLVNIIVYGIPAALGTFSTYINNYRNNDVGECEKDRWDSYANLTATILLIIISFFTIAQKGGERRQMFLNGAKMYTDAANRIDIELSLKMAGRECSSPEILINTMSSVVKTTDHDLLTGNYISPNEFHTKIGHTLRVLGARDIESILRVMCPDGDEDCIVQRRNEIVSVSEVRLDV